MYCRNCGNELPEESNFCPKCGAEQTGDYNRSSFMEFAQNVYRRHKVLVILYGVWLLIHLSLFISADKTRCYDPEDFYPFRSTLSDIVDGQKIEIEFWGQTINSYGTLELFVYTILLPLFIYGLYKGLPLLYGKVRMYINKRKQSHAENSDNGENTSGNGISSETTPDVHEFTKATHSKKEPEALMVTMPLYLRLIGSIIDQIIILLIILLILLLYLLISPYDAPRMLGAITALMLESPKYLTEQGITADAIVQALILTINFFYFLFTETKMKASWGKCLTKGILLDSNKQIISNISQRNAVRLVMNLAFILIFHSGMLFYHIPIGLGLPAIFLPIIFSLINMLPILFIKQSLIDLATGTIYAKRK